VARVQLGDDGIPRNRSFRRTCTAFGLNSRPRAILFAGTFNVRIRCWGGERPPEVGDTRRLVRGVVLDSADVVRPLNPIVDRRVDI
jgi:hypothetical protein